MKKFIWSVFNVMQSAFSILVSPKGCIRPQVQWAQISFHRSSLFKHPEGTISLLFSKHLGRWGTDIKMKKFFYCLRMTQTCYSNCSMKLLRGFFCNGSFPWPQYTSDKLSQRMGESGGCFRVGQRVVWLFHVVFISKTTNYRKQIRFAQITFCEWHVLKQLYKSKVTEIIHDNITNS